MSDHTCALSLDLAALQQFCEGSSATTRDSLQLFAQFDKNFNYVARFGIAKVDYK